VEATRLWRARCDTASSLGEFSGAGSPHSATSHHGPSINPFRTPAAPLWCGILPTRSSTSVGQAAGWPPQGCRLKTVHGDVSTSVAVTATQREAGVRLCRRWAAWDPPLLAAQSLTPATASRSVSRIRCTRVTHLQPTSRATHLPPPRHCGTCVLWLRAGWLRAQCGGAHECRWPPAYTDRALVFNSSDGRRRFRRRRNVGGAVGSTHLLGGQQQRGGGRREGRRARRQQAASSHASAGGGAPPRRRRHAVSASPFELTESMRAARWDWYVAYIGLEGTRTGRPLLPALSEPLCESANGRDGLCHVHACVTAHARGGSAAIQVARPGTPLPLGAHPLDALALACR